MGRDDARVTPAGDERGARAEDAATPLLREEDVARRRTRVCWSRVAGATLVVGSAACAWAAARARWAEADDGGASARAALRMRHARVVVGDRGDGFYAIRERVKAVRQKSTDGALVYVGLTLPGASGSFLEDAFSRQSRATNGRQDVLRLGEFEAKNVDGSDAFFPDPVGVTESTFEETFEHFTRRSPSEYYGSERLRKMYDVGARVYFGGDRGMGLCDRVDAPCSYITVLRDPVEQFVSQYASACLAGSNDRSAWSYAMKAKGSCDMGLIQWFDWYKESENGWLNLIAPGLSANKDAQVAAAIHNLDKECFRFLLANNIEDGLDRLSEDPDFLEIDTSEMKKTAAKELNSQPKLGERELKILESQTSNEGVMSELRNRLRRERAVYTHALNTYETKWKSRWFSC